MTVDVYEQYFEANADVNGRKRHAALVKLISDSCDGMIRYEAFVSFFPHDDEEDYAVSYDACYSKEICYAKGRRSKKKEAVYLEGLQKDIDELASEINAEVFWDRPLREERRG